MKRAINLAVLVSETMSKQFPRFLIGFGDEPFPPEWLLLNWRKACCCSFFVEQFLLSQQQA